MKLKNKFEYLVTRALTSLPHPWQIKLAGGKPVMIDGEVLHPEVQLLLALQKKRKDKPFHELGVMGSRKVVRHTAAVFAGYPADVRKVEDVKIDCGSTQINARHYFPKQTDRHQTLIVYYHGGGFVFGDLETHDVVCRTLSQELGAQVLSVEYRLAPEFIFPTAIEDSKAAYLWSHSQAESWGVDPKKIIVAGDSAGGNIATVIAQIARNENLPRPMLQLLIYPAVDRKIRYPSQSHFADGFVLTRHDLDWFEKVYAPGVSHDDPRVSPLHAHSLANLPPALIVTAGFDPLRDEGQTYARALEEAGVKVKCIRAKGMVHGFIQALGYGTAHQKEFLRIIQGLKEFITELSHEDRT